ncbi:unnamed protein product [Durusdinium trenchii]|uniref:SMP-LTD domain-containing protein n=1 Tax=Durusdinium trenchii TaxID=1381693 RepID=A0ABP0IGS0_9DINO
MFNCCCVGQEATEEAQSKQVAINGQSTNKYSRPDDGGDDQSETKTNANSPAGRRPSVRSTNQTSPREYHEVYENGVEHLAWLNQSLKHLWPEMSEAARAIAHSKVLPVIKSKLIAKGKGAITDVKFDQFTLGSQPVVLGPIQVSRMPRGSVRIRVLLDYRSDMHVGLDLDTSYGNWRFGMKDFRIVGEMVLRVRPHIPDSPGTGGVSIFFVDPPKVDFTFSGNMSFGNFPFIKEAIRHACDSIIADMFVLPNVASQHMSLTDLKMYPLVFSSPVPVGILRVTLVQTKLDAKDILLPEDQHAKKPTAGIFRRMASGVGKVLKGVAYAWEETEEFLERQVGSVIGVTTEPYMKWQLGQQVWMPDFKPGASFNFAMYDPEQHLQVSLWDRDLLSQDDLMGEIKPIQAIKAIMHSEESISLIIPGEEGRQAGTFSAKIEFLVTSPGLDSREGYVVVIRVREILQAGSGLKGKRLAVRATFKEEQILTKAGAGMLDITETIPAKAMLKKIQDNMKQEGVEETTIDKILDLTALQQSRIAMNRSLHFVVSNEDVKTEQVHLSLVDMDVYNQKKGKDRKATPRSPRPIEEDEDEVVASKEISLAELYGSTGFAMPGPFDFYSDMFGKIEVKMHVHLPLSLDMVSFPAQ